MDCKLCFMGKVVNIRKAPNSAPHARSMSSGGNGSPVGRNFASLGKMMTFALHYLLFECACADMHG